MGGLAAPWAKRKFECLAQGAAIGGGSATPDPRGGSAPLGPIAQNFVFGCLAQGAARTTPWAIGGGLAAPKPAGLGVAEPPRPNGVAGHHLWGGTTPTYFLDFFSFFFLDFFFLKKKCDGGILGINGLNELNYHNLKVWDGKVSHFKLWRQK
jgi:hypothetical protein